ncbi:hypothetical protein VMF7928_01899 [Vibrio marisflavi CECT 7928]|uniref:Uncharacterized protein n=1 Tax=Vibrio marisflavi CECT 7928 TaxID=634439 RepID=A0ABM9A331_9VIBR|nr:hypothetical protein VMF7928_01899 [Vibrio marisflavi CECT 7928]
MIKLLTQISDLWDKQNWEKMSKEISSLEEVYKSKATAEIELYKQESVRSVQNIKKDELTARYELEALVGVIQKMICEEQRSYIYALLLHMGTASDQRYMKAFYTSDEQIGAAMCKVGETLKGHSIVRSNDRGAS